MDNLHVSKFSRRHCEEAPQEIPRPSLRAPRSGAKQSTGSGQAPQSTSLEIASATFGFSPRNPTILQSCKIEGSPRASSPAGREGNDEEKISRLKQIISSYGSVLVAFSGGVDSTLVLKVAREVLGCERVKAATSVTESFTETEFSDSKKLADLIGVEQIVVRYSELAIPGYAENTARRCYFCKDALYERLHQLREQLGLNVLANGTNLDDVSDFRPGNDAAKKHGVRSPLLEAGLTKADVREISKFYDLPTWGTPANACLSSRVPYGEPVTAEKLEQIEKGETFLRSLGFKQVRLRHHNQVARIEVGPEEIARFFDEDIRNKIDSELRQLGFLFITLDLAGYRAGALNEVLNKCHPSTA